MPRTEHPTHGGTRRIVVMGVAGSGKTSVGVALADRLGLDFVDADDLHPPANVAKMRAGRALADADRMPWLDVVGAALAGAAPPGIVVACSSLRRAYRDRLRAAAPDAVFVALEGDEALLAERIGGRVGHFMPASLLASQLAAYEAPDADERAVRVDVTDGVDEIAAVAASALDRLDEPTPT
ncbi:MULTISPECIES: gluconokinase [unclassified Agromyces]|uniref:gluconokinase n=1 Tax=unclassified Agromyces TaxID=2639701 RepID=UPI003014A031